MSNTTADTTIDINALQEKMKLYNANLTTIEKLEQRKLKLKEEEQLLAEEQEQLKEEQSKLVADIKTIESELDKTLASQKDNITTLNSEVEELEIKVNNIRATNTRLKSNISSYKNLLR